MRATTRTHQYSRNDLRARGWTPAMVRQYLGQPDTIVRIWRTSHHMHLFEVGRVEQAEAQPEWGARADEAAQRSAAGKARAETAAAKTVEWAQAVEVKVPVMPMEELFDRAKESYEGLWAYRGEMRFADGDNEEFLHRIAVNYLRHECTKYERLLASSRGEVGRLEAQAVIRERVLDAIADAYPDLEDECWAQQVRRMGQEGLMMLYATERPELGEARVNQEPLDLSARNGRAEH